MEDKSCDEDWDCCWCERLDMISPLLLRRCSALIKMGTGVVAVATSVVMRCGGVLRGGGGGANCRC